MLHTIIAKSCVTELISCKLLPQDWKRSVFIPIPKKGNAKECSNYHTSALISQAQHLLDHQKAREFQKNIYFCFIDYTKVDWFDCVDHSKLCKILKKMWIPDHLTCLLRNLYAGQEPTVRTGHGKTGLVQNWERSTSELYIVTLLI